MKTALPFVATLLLAMSSLLGGCNTNDPTTGATLVEGQVVEIRGRQPVAGALVQVYQAGRGGGYGAVGSPCPADAQGRFSFHFDATTKSGYLLKASAPPGYLTDWGLAPNLTAGRKNTGLLIPMYAPAWVRLQLVDEPPKSRVLMFIAGYEGSGDRLYYPRDTTLIRPLLAGFPGKIIWVITNQQGIDTQFEQAINPAPLDTLTVRIPF